VTDKESGKFSIDGRKVIVTTTARRVEVRQGVLGFHFARSGWLRNRKPPGMILVTNPH
jgi:hypothetical protein